MSKCIDPRRRPALLSLAWAALVVATFIPTSHAAEGFRPRDTQMSGQPLAPREAVARLRVPPGFRVTLAAAEPDVRQPIAIAYDERGRLWVAESYSYNGSDFTDERHDRILIFEDKDGDGVFEAPRVFHDGLNRLTGLAVGFGGVWATTAPAVVFIPDRNRDDRPDAAPEVILDGWTLKAEHNTVNGLTWGPDGWLYGRHGIKEPSRPGLPGTPMAQRAAVSCAIWRYHPVKRQFEILAEGTINPWGLDFDATGQMFISTSVVDHLWHVVPGSKFKRWLGRDVPLYPHVYDLMGPASDHSHRPAERQTTAEATANDDSFAGGAAHAEAMIYLGDRWPESYRGAVLMSNIHGRRINQDRPRRASEREPLTASHDPDFLRTDDAWFRAVSMLYGPDGDVVMTDWSDFGECHDRDGVHRSSGRIYKISYGAPRKVEVDLSLATLPELVALQSHRNEWFARQARRVLQERAAAGVDVKETHDSLRRMFSSDAASVHRLRALWALHVSGGATADWLKTLFDDRDEHVRYWAIQLAVELGVDRGATLSDRARMENSWLVRMALASTLPRLSREAQWTVGAALAESTQAGDDMNFLRLLWIGWNPAVAAQPAAALELASRVRAPLLREWIARRIAEEAAQQPVLADALIRAAAGNMSEEIRTSLLAGAAAGLSIRAYTISPEAMEALRQCYASPKTAVRTAALTLGAVGKDQAAIARLRERMESPQADVAERSDALRLLVALRPPWLASVLLELIEKRQLLEPAIRGLAVLDDARGIAAMLTLYASLERPLRSAVIDAMISRPASLPVLIDAMTEKRIPAKDVTHAQARQLAKVASPALRQRFEQEWGKLNSSSDAVAAQVRRLRATMKPDFLQLADRKRGAELFEQRCAACHTLFGRGGKLAPDLTGSGRKDVDYLILNVVDPNAEIPADWRLAVATTNDGRVVSGSIVSESASAVTLQSPEGITTIERVQVKSIERLNTSLMPTGLLDDLKPDEIRDLFGFLMSDVATSDAMK